MLYAIIVVCKNLRAKVHNSRGISKEIPNYPFVSVSQRALFLFFLFLPVVPLYGVALHAGIAVAGTAIVDFIAIYFLHYLFNSHFHAGRM